MWWAQVIKKDPQSPKKIALEGKLENDFCLHTMLLRFDVQLATWP
jgi:hypothetical protein